MIAWWLYTVPSAQFESAVWRAAAVCVPLLLALHFRSRYR